MKIILIGAGNLATNLGKALKKAGHDILQVYSRTATSAEALAAILDCPATTDLTTIDNRADVYILSIKDKALRDIISELTRTLISSGAALSEKVFLHTAGSMPMDVFKDKAPHYGVFYPMQTFSKVRETDFSIIPTFIEWNDETAHTRLATLAQSVTRRVYPLSTADRKYLHLSAVWACNFVNHCYDIAANILAAHHLPRAQLCATTKMSLPPSPPSSPMIPSSGNSMSCCQRAYTDKHKHNSDVSAWQVQSHRYYFMIDLLLFSFLDSHQFHPIVDSVLLSIVLPLFIQEALSTPCLSVFAINIPDVVHFHFRVVSSSTL